MPDFHRFSDIARASPGGDACQQPPADMRSGRVVLRRPRTAETTAAAKEDSGKKGKKCQDRKLECGFDDWERERASRGVQKKENRYPMCTGNKVDRQSAKELGEGFKIIYSGEKSSRNGVGVILSPEFTEKVVEVSRPSDRLIKLKLVIVGEIFNIVSAYAPQSGETDTIKECFLKDWEDLMTRVPRTEKIVVGADLNGHVGKNPGVFQRVRGGGKGYGQRNREGKNILESTESLDLALVNTFFNKTEEHLNNYKSGGNSSQIDFIMTRRADLKEMRDCKVIPGEEVVSQHRLLCVVLRTKEAKHSRRNREKKKIWALKGKKVMEYRDKVEEEYQLEADINAEESWKIFKKVIMKAAEETCGATKGGKHLERETWWWNEEVQS